MHELYDINSGDTNCEPIGNTFIDKLKNVAARRQVRDMIPAADRRSAEAVLDYGTGNSRFALVCSELFPQAEVHALDYQEQVPCALLDRGPRIRYVQHDEWRRTNRKYDLILLRHVLEHNHDPVGLLRRLAQRLTPTGRLYLEVPNLDSWFVGKLGHLVNTPYVPFHIWHFSRAPLQQIIQDCGMRCRMGYSEMPLMGSSLAMLLGQQKNLLHQVAGVALHRAQLVLSAIFGAPCVTAVCWR